VVGEEFVNYLQGRGNCIPTIFLKAGDAENLDIFIKVLPELQKISQASVSRNDEFYL